MASELDDYLDLIDFTREQTAALGVEGFWEWMAEIEPDFREQIIGVMTDPAFALEEHQRMPRGEWRIWMKRMGRGAGKTYGAATNTNLLARDVFPGGYGILVGPTVKHVRDIMIDGPSGIIATAPLDCVPVFLSIGVQKGPPIGVQKGPPSSSSVTGMTGAPFALVAA